VSDLAPSERLIVALDVPGLEPALALARRLKGHVGAFKVGLELFNAAGPAGLAAIVATGVKVFYDCKLHDIPNTVAGAVRVWAGRGLWMLNVHAGGGSAMMRAAVEAAQLADPVGTGGPAASGTPTSRSSDRPLVIAVTVLTSIDSRQLREELGARAGARTQVLRLARLAQDSGLDGVVASPLEAAAIRRACGPDFVIVTPGIRPAGAALGDQQRAATPAAAVAAGSDYLVVGRPITAAADPVAAADAIAEELA
jgi:orotidine-5'-phosphate decarboxylase